MQAQRSTLHPIPETFDLENMSDQPNVDIESQIYPVERTTLMDAPNLPDYQAVGSSPSCSFRNIGSQSSGSSSFVNGWPTGSVTNSDISADQGCTSEDKMVIGWNPVSNGQSTSRFERQVVDSHVLHSESVSVDALNNQAMDDRLHLRSSCNYGTTSDGNNYNFSTNQTAGVNEGQPFMDLSCCPHPGQLAGSDSEQVPFACSSMAGCMPENSNGRANHPMDGRRGSCKRKTVESISGPSSLDVLPCSSQWDDGHLRLTAPGRHNISSNLNIPATTATIPAVRPVEEPVMPRANVGDVGPDFRGLSMVGQSEAPQRAVRARHNPPHQQEQSLPQIWPSGNVGRYIPDLQPNSSHSRRMFSGDQSADTGPAGVSTSAQLRQPSMFHVPSGIQRSLHSVGWNESSSMPRLGNASSSSNAGARERSSSQQEEASSRNMMMGIASNAWFVAGSENRATNHESGNWVSVNRNPNGPGDIASSMLHPLPSMPWGSHHIPLTQAPRRSSGSSQGQGLSSSVSRPSQGSHFNPSRNIHSSSSSDVPVPVPPVTGLQVPQYLRSAAVLMERQGDGLVGVPFGSLQAIAAEGDGRNRLMTEIRSVLELVRSRRGDNLRFEDILILDQSAFYAAADAHDQHRDMRLDVDNMTYEELLDLEERIGNVSTGLSEETVLKCLKRSAYYSGIESSADEASKKQPEDELCSICREEYKDNEELGILDCGHIHHSHCIRKWLLLKNLCPICKKTALNV